MVLEHAPTNNVDKRMEQSKQQIQALMEKYKSGKCGLHEFTKGLAEIRQEYYLDTVQRLS